MILFVDNLWMSQKEKMGKRLKRAREESGYTLHSLSDAVNGLYSPSRLGNYEQGIRELPIDVAKSVSRVIGCSALWLLCLEDEPLKKDEQALIENYRAANDQGKKTISSVAESQLDYSATNQKTA